MGMLVKNKKNAPMDLLIDFFASLYDLIIAFFASLYDLAYNFIKLVLKIRKIASLNFLINFFAFQYDAVYYFIKFIFDYLKWIVGSRSTKSPVFVPHTEQLIQIHS
jgi:hypothetical protein